MPPRDSTDVETFHSTGEESSQDDPLKVLAYNLSGQYKLATNSTDKSLILDQLRQHKKIIDDAYQQFSSLSQTETPLVYAGEWLLDNFFVVQQAINQVQEDLPIGYYQELPKLINPEWVNTPRNYAMAGEIITYFSDKLDIEQVIRFLQMFQSDMPLTMGELWAFPTMLRMGILRSLANSLTEFIQVETSTLSSVKSPKSDDNTVRFCITSLRLLAVQDWKVFFEQVSLVDKALRFDPANVYASMDFDTRNSYRRAIECLARVTKQTEDHVTQQAIMFSQKADPSSRQSHVGYYLIGEGYHQLEDRLHYHPSKRLALRRWLHAHATPVYLGSIWLLTFLLMLLLLRYGISTGDSWIQILGISLLSFLPASAIASSLVNWAVTNTIAPHLLPRMDFRESIPRDYRTMVVIPTLLNDSAEIDSLLQQLELHFLRNADSALFFALLTDYSDAPTQQMPDDEDLINRTKIGISALNAKYRPDAPPFYLFHRERQWNAAQNSWMGWERKRGKLMEFNHLLRGNETTSYIVHVGDLSVLPHIKYVITLDADTILPEGSARLLVATLAHPLNRAVYDPKSGKVVSGYSILQPRVEIKPTSANKTRFTRIFAGDMGLDLYTHAVSEVYQDLFGEGSYVGKGIYDVDILEVCPQSIPCQVT